MLTTAVLPLLVALSSQAPVEHDMLNVSSDNFLKWAAGHRTEIIAKPRQGPGPDHGGDPNDETHDYGLPANAHAGDGYPSDDPYNDTTPNNKNKPYKPY
jgi:hypothetical protein